MEWYWWALFGALIGSLIGIPVLNKRILQARLNQAGLDDPERMTDQEMADHMARLFGALGYQVSRPEPDEAAFDLVLRDGLGQHRGVLIRHWRVPVDEGIVQRAVQAAAHLEKGAPMIVTVRYFTWKARQLAQQHGAILWTLTDLTKAIGRLKEEANATAARRRQEEVTTTALEAVHSARQQEAEHAMRRSGALADLTAAEYVEDWSEDEEPSPHDPRWAENTRGNPVPRCPRCGRRMIIRRQSGRRYWGCPAYPRCLGTLRT
jgi:hypothetical protein